MSEKNHEREKINEKERKTMRKRENNEKERKIMRETKLMRKRGKEGNSERVRDRKGVIEQRVKK